MSKFSSPSTRSVRATRARLGIGPLALGAIVASGLAFFGCGGESQTVDPSGVLAPTTESSARFAPPSMDDLTSTLGLTEAQTESLKPALDAWRSASSDRGTARHQAMMDFLVTSSDVLDRDALVALVQLIDQRIQAHREAMAQDGRRGPRGERGSRGPHGNGDGDRPGMHGPRGDGVGGGFGGSLDDLDLSSAQKDLLESARTAHHAAVKTVREKYGDDVRNNEAFREEMSALREAFHAQVRDILTPEQIAQLEGDRSERFLARVQAQIARISEHSDERLAFLTKLLDLTDTQKTQILALHGENVANLQAIIDGLRGGSLTLEQAHQMLRDRERAHGQVEALLTPEQLEIFQSLPGLWGGRGDGGHQMRGSRGKRKGAGMHERLHRRIQEGPFDREGSRSRTI